MPILELLDDESSTSLDLNNKLDYSQLTEEEQHRLFDYISSQVANDREAFERLAIKFLEETTRDDFNTVNVQPQAGLVYKTHVVSTKNKKYPIDTLVYINICYANAIPAPPNISEQELLKSIEGEPGSSVYKIPLSLGEERRDKDNLIMDACLNTQTYLRCEKDLDYSLYVLEIAMEYIEEKMSIHLSREFTMPNIKSKGQIPSRILRLPKPSLMTAVKNSIKSPWKLKPIITMEKEMLRIRIPMPDKNFTLWKIDLLTDKIILTIQDKPMDIVLPCSVDTKDTEFTQVDFYKKSQDLIIRLKSVIRTQYL